MKLVRLPAQGGGHYWVIVHDLTVAEGRCRYLRPIHVLTLLGQLKAGKYSVECFSLCHVLENKLFGVRYHLEHFSKSVAPVRVPIYTDHYVRDYHDEQAMICALEAYLTSIYSTLEITAKINRLFHASLPINFRRQSIKFPTFAFDRWEWLGPFFDLRSELTHYSSALPEIKGQKIIIEFRSMRELEYFEKGSRYSVSFDAISGFAVGLFDLLDAWAIQELESIDGELDVDVVEETGWKRPLKTKRIKAREILQLIREAPTAQSTG